MRIRSRHSRRTVPIHRSAKAFATGVRIGVLTTVICSDAKIVSNVVTNFASRSRIKNRAGAGEGVDEVAGLLDSPGTGRMFRDPREVHASAVEFDEEQDVQPLECEGVDGEEVTRD